MPEGDRVLVAMSGGVDSSVAAMLLARQGHELVGVTMKTWNHACSGVPGKETGCCNLDAIHDARHLATSMGFPHFVADLREEFNQHIIHNFVDEYLHGRTPNPCVLCNTHIKWGALLKRADRLGCSHIATGHYARILQKDGRYVLATGRDSGKDQSYVLWGLGQGQLKRTLFPLGNLSKSTIREVAREAGFADIASRRESYDICFIPGGDYRTFLNHRVPGLGERLEGGAFVDGGGRLLGKHQGYPFYTIGQRKGLPVVANESLHVRQIIPQTNTIVLGRRQDLLTRSFCISGFNPVKYDPLPPGLSCTVKVRYRDKPRQAQVFPERGLVRIRLQDPAEAVTPGQSAVLYEGEEVLGGGFIECHENETGHEE
jgi:tRNA-specific 2-thiouridylase